MKLPGFAGGADMVMVKPGMPYLDIIREAGNFCSTVFLSGFGGVCDAYGRVPAWLADEEQTVLESLICFKRAGQTAYRLDFASWVAQWLNRHQREY